MALILPNGVEERGFCALVALGAVALELIVKWFRPLVDSDMMHKKWRTDSIVRYENCHLEYARFNEFLKSHQSRSSDWIEQKAFIILPFSLQSNIFDKQNTTWLENCALMAYIRLKALNAQYDIAEDREDFEVRFRSLFVFIESLVSFSKKFKKFVDFRKLQRLTMKFLITDMEHVSYAIMIWYRFYI